MGIYRVDPLFADSTYAILAGWLCLVVSLFLAFRRPACNAFLTLTLVGIGGAPIIAGYTYGRLTAFVGLLTLLALQLRRRSRGAVHFKALARTPLSWYGGICLVIFAKIMGETIIYGLDLSRRLNLTSGLTEVLFPVSVLLLSVMKAGPESTARDVLIGMIVFPLLMIAGYLPFAFREGLIAAAWLGESRFTIGAADTINSARVLAYGAIASLVYFSLPRKSVDSLVLAFLALLFFGFTMLVLLTGNRQFLLALLCALLLWAFFLQPSGLTHLLTSVVVFIGLAALLYNVLTQSDLSVKGRISGSAMTTEVSMERGPIWADAYKDALRHPVLGTGFKNFGDEAELEVPATGEIITLRDSAHGVLQDIFTEHGVILGVLFLLGCMELIWCAMRAIWLQKSPCCENALALVFLAMLPPLLFSGGFLNATPIYGLLVLAAVQYVRRRQVRTKRVEIAALRATAKG
jgi:hypothetical protein